MTGWSADIMLVPRVAATNQFESIKQTLVHGSLTVHYLGWRVPLFTRQCWASPMHKSLWGKLVNVAPLPLMGRVWMYAAQRALEWTRWLDPLVGRLEWLERQGV